MPQRSRRRRMEGGDEVDGLPAFETGGNGQESGFAADRASETGLDLGRGRAGRQHRPQPVKRGSLDRFRPGRFVGDGHRDRTTAGQHDFLV